jgi:hypothetical protein
MDLHFETHLYLHLNNDMYMWNQVNCTQNCYTNIGTSDLIINGRIRWCRILITEYMKSIVTSGAF